MAEKKRDLPLGKSAISAFSANASFKKAAMLTIAIMLLSVLSILVSAAYPDCAQRCTWAESCPAPPGLCNAGLPTCCTSYGCNNEVGKCANSVDDDCDGLTDCADPDCVGAVNGAGKTCCQSASTCAQDDCVAESCVSNTCTYTNRATCDATECSAGFFCGSPGGNCMKLYENTQELCSNGADDNCNAFVDSADQECYGSVFSGTVFAGTGTDVVFQAHISTNPTGSYSVNEKSTTTSISGTYSIAQVAVGTYLARASKNGYITDVKKITVISNQTTTQNFRLYEGINCKPDCTDENNNCQAACEGLNFTVPGGVDTCQLAHPNCNEIPAGFAITYNDDSGNSHKVTCCEGPDVAQGKQKKLDVTSLNPTKNCVDYTKNAWFEDGNLVKIHYHVCS